MEKENPKPADGFIKLTLFGFLLLVILFIGLKVWLTLFENSNDTLPMETSVIYQPAPTPGRDLEAIETDAEIKIPASAREIHAVISGWQEVNAWVRLDLPATDLKAFLQNSRCTTPLAPTAPAEYLPGDLDPDWRQMGKAARLEKCSGLRDHLSQQIWVDGSKRDVVRIYVFSATANFTKFTTLTAEASR